jgi:hypothetical protein
LLKNSQAEPEQGEKRRETAVYIAENAQVEPFSDTARRRPSVFQQTASVSAERVVFVDALPDPVLRSRIWLSAEGFREEPELAPTQTGPRLTYVNRNSTGERWLLSPDAKKAARLPMRDEQGAAPRTLAGGVLTRQPCRGLSTARRLSDESYEGFAVQRWVCSGVEDSGAALTQLFAPALDLVVWEERAEGSVTALRAIVRGPQPRHLFEPPPDYNVVSITEFFVGPPPLPRY